MNIQLSTTRHLTLRALVGGIIIGALLTPCNIYSGLKIGWSFNISIIALLLVSGFWALVSRYSRATTLSQGEANITQTTASSSANIISGGLVAPIPALAMMQGENLPADKLIVWVFAVSFLGIWVAWYMRRSLLVDAKLPFPTGRATAETLTEIFSTGREAAIKLRMLLGSTLLAGTLKWLDSGAYALPRPGLGFTLPAWGKMGAFAGISARNLTFTFDSSPLLIGFGAIIGIKNGVSLLLGSVIAWGILAPWGLSAGFITPGGNSLQANWFAAMIEWLLWPGVAVMVSSALTRFGLHLTATRKARQNSGALRQREAYPALRLAGLALSSALVVWAQMSIFDIAPLIAVLAVPIAFVLAVVASRVVGETGIPPIGAIGKVSQLGTGLMAPGETTANLMGANVAGGAAGQSADLLNDLKVGQIIGAPPVQQVIAQFFGILTGSVVGSLVYLQLIPDPGSMLVTETWPAPAVATWKVVAETLSVGIGAMPPSALWAVLAGSAVGMAGAWLQHRHTSKWIPNMPALGLAMVIPASISIAMFIGSAIAKLLEHYRPGWAKRFVIAGASGLIAGESLIGVVRTLLGISG